MVRRIVSGVDPLVRLLLVAIVLATVLPVTGAARDVAQIVSNSAIFLLFLLNGLRLPRDEVVRGLSNLRFLLPLVLWCFGAMVLAGWGISLLTVNLLPPLVALGFLYLGALPGTVQSATAYSSIAGGNVALSVVAAALLNILGVFISAPLFSALAGSHGAEFDGGSLIKVALILLLPFVIGQLAQHRFGHLVKEHRMLVDLDGSDFDRDCRLCRVFWRGRAEHLGASRSGRLGRPCSARSCCFLPSHSAERGCSAGRCACLGRTGSRCCSPEGRRALRWAHRLRPFYSPPRPASCCCRCSSTTCCSWCCRLRWLRDWPGVSEADRVAQMARRGFLAIVTHRPPE